ncbi:uncharacterized protein LOC118750246 [Rhagoletis pomonella]|uniref:uncharacterized protein LOC118750246 n=1 Tax=Rhagoletis pomonella TaxID=28610 RepID=UPI00177E6A05|nr:uncharacterized protein LOC118750246 [Rhagoletis pomonella]
MSLVKCFPVCKSAKIVNILYFVITNPHINDSTRATVTTTTETTHCNLSGSSTWKLPILPRRATIASVQGTSRKSAGSQNGNLGRVMREDNKGTWQLRLRGATLKDLDV